jgi:hypothetical protein
MKNLVVIQEEKVSVAAEEAAARADVTSEYAEHLHRHRNDRVKTKTGRENAAMSK